MTFTDILMNGASLQDASLFAVRASVGVFFAISGAHKLFNPTRRASLKATFQADHVPLMPFMVVIPCGELLGGLGVAFGALTVVAACGLFALCMGACFLDGFKRIPGMQPLDAADAADDVLYLPEVLYAVMLLAVIGMGPGAWSLDALALHFLA